MIPVILSGGGGARLWPKSRQNYPKQFLSLSGDNTLLQDTLLRLDGLEGLDQPIFVTNENHRFLLAEQIRSIGKTGRILLEPLGRNTAPAIALAALSAMEGNQQDPVLLVLPSDHLIRDIKSFHVALEHGKSLAEDGKLVTFGVPASQPEVGFGYIKKGRDIKNGFQIDSFVEKPDRDAAQKYIDSGQYLWNSGMFIFKASIFLAELKRYAPDIYDKCRESHFSRTVDLDFIRIPESQFSLNPDISIDNAVMEKTKKGVVVPMFANWNDIGSWQAVWDEAEKDAKNNAVIGDVFLSNSHNNLIHSDSSLIAGIGINNLVIVQTPDVTLISNKNDAQNIKEVVEALRTNNRTETKFHKTDHRPWGSFETMNSGEGYLVKHVKVKPGGSLSLQKHQHRAEHWIVVKGQAKITKGDSVFVMERNESTYIPVGVEHRLENCYQELLEVIEIQTGSHLSEDDIVRIRDDYGRSE